MLKTKFNHIGNLVKRFKDLHKSTMQIGYFPENGIHPSGLSFSGLFAIQSFGAPSVGIVPRPVLDLEFSTYSPLSKNIILKTQLKKYLSNIKSKTPKLSVTLMLSTVAGDYVMKTRDSFGDTSKLADNTEFTQFLKNQDGVKPNNPLIWHGTLRSNLSYKINGETVVTP